MSTASTTQDTSNPSFWQRSLNWIRALDEAVAYDPTQASIDQLTHEMAQLKGTLRRVEDQLNERNSKGLARKI